MNRKDILAAVNELGSARCNLQNSFETEMEKQAGFYLLRQLEELQMRLTLVYNAAYLNELGAEDELDHDFIFQISDLNKQDTVKFGINELIKKEENKDGS